MTERKRRWIDKYTGAERQNPVHSYTVRQSQADRKKRQKHEDEQHAKTKSDSKRGKRRLRQRDERGIGNIIARLSVNLSVRESKMLNHSKTRQSLKLNTKANCFGLKSKKQHIVNGKRETGNVKCCEQYRLSTISYQYRSVRRSVFLSIRIICLHSTFLGGFYLIKCPMSLFHY